jgi:ketosteroid isomerase-like protein
MLTPRRHGRFLAAAAVVAGALLVAPPLPRAAAEGPIEPATKPDVAALAAEVRAAELAFAQTMADRDLASFGEFVAEEAVFLGQTALRGRDAVVAGWSVLFQGEAAPFSWKPEVVEVLDSGGLALSSGPVLDAKGERVGTFQSIWRLEPDGRWRVVFDKGCPPCACGE